MFELLQTVITVALSAIIGGQVAVTRTSRLRRTIDATISLRDRFPVGVGAARVARRQLREHPPPAQQPTETG